VRGVERIMRSKCMGSSVVSSGQEMVGYMGEAVHEDDAKMNRGYKD
jgi:hypothetical protein